MWVLLWAFHSAFSAHHLRQVFLDWLRVGGLFSRFCLAPRAKTQLEMDRLYVDEADIYLAFRCQVQGGDMIAHYNCV